MPAGNILVADANAAIRTVVGQALARAGYEARAAGTASALWNSLQLGSIDLVLADVTMSDGNAIDLLAAVKKARGYGDGVDGAPRSP